MKKIFALLLILTACAKNSGRDPSCTCKPECYPKNEHCGCKRDCGCRAKP